MRIAKNRLYYSDEIITKDLMGLDILVLHICDGTISPLYRMTYMPSSTSYGGYTYIFNLSSCGSVKAKDGVKFHEIKMVKAV